MKISLYDKNQNDEQIYDDFISRIEFINESGVFVTPIYFRAIHRQFEQSGIASPYDFAHSYVRDRGQWIQTIELANGDVFKFDYDDFWWLDLMDFDDERIEVPNLMELMNYLAEGYYHKWREADRIAEEYGQLFHELVDLVQRGAGPGCTEPQES